MRVSQQVVDRHKNKLTQVLANVPANKHYQFANVLTGAALNFLTDEEFDECCNAARMFVAADDAMVGN